MERTAEQLISREELSGLLKLNNKSVNFIVPYIMKLIKLDKINTLYKRSSNSESGNFVDKVLGGLNIKFEVKEEELKNIPASGAFVTMSNHPYGGLDGLILMSLMQQVRKDFKIAANYILKKIPEFSDSLISVDPFKKKSNEEVSIAGVKSILNHLKEDGGVGLFPAGEVSSFKTSSMKIEDKKWNPVAGKIILKTGVPVIPVYFSGSNGIIFNMLGMIHPALRTIMLPSELINKNNFNIRIRIGKPITSEKLSEFDDVNQMMRYLRAKTYSLGSSLEVNSFFMGKDFSEDEKEKIIEPVEVNFIKSELKLIRESDFLFNVSSYEVFISEADSIPFILREIGRLRETTFRENGEGTNRSVDLDEFDLYYRHLFIWDKENEKIAGAYRIGIGKEIFKKYKRNGFYINKLFKIKKHFKETLKCSLELGRSFVAKDYQKKHMILFLLWKGVLEFVKKSGSDVKYLIGPVSISNDFSTFSKEILVKFIKKYYYDEEMALYVKPRKQFRPEINEDETDILLEKDGTDFKLIDKLISEIEISNNKAPVLLKKYLSQNAKIIGFSVDPKFNNSLDGFLVMNLDNLPEDTITMLDK